MTLRYPFPIVIVITLADNLRLFYQSAVQMYCNYFWEAGKIKNFCLFWFFYCCNQYCTPIFSIYIVSFEFNRALNLNMLHISSVLINFTIMWNFPCKHLRVNYAVCWWFLLVILLSAILSIFHWGMLFFVFSIYLLII